MLYVDANLERRTPKDIVRAVRQFAERSPADAIGFETDQFQQSLADQMQADGSACWKLWQVLQMPTGGAETEVPDSAVFAVHHATAIQVPRNARLPAAGRPVNGLPSR